MDAAELRRAYDDLLAEVAAGGFGAPPPGGLTVAQTVAHLAANDELMVETTEAVLAGSPWTYYDAQPTLPPQVDAMVTHPAGLSGLAAWLHTTSGRLCGLMDRLGTAAETPVDCHLREGDELYVEESMPWARMLDIHARIHLPAHTRQLRALRVAG